MTSGNPGDLIKGKPETYRYLRKEDFIEDNDQVYLGGNKPQVPGVDLYDVVEAAIENDTGVQTKLQADIEAADLDVTGDWSFDDDVALNENLEFTETVTSPATSSTLTLVQKQLVHSITQGATDEIEIDVPDGALLFSAELLVSVALTFTTGTAVTASWTNSTQQIGGTDALAAKNSKVTAFYNANAESAIAGGTPETITLTADAGTVDDGEVVVIVRYWTLSGIADVA